MSIAREIAITFWAYLLEAGPWLLVGFAIAGAMHALVSPALMQRWLGAGHRFAVLRAAAIGVPLPLCSCSVIPAAAALRARGASRGASAAFAISTPEVDAPSISLTWGMLGPWMAITRPIAAFATALGVGWLIDRFDRQPTPRVSTADAPTPPACCAEHNAADSCHSPQANHADHRAPHPLLRAIEFALITLPRNLGLWVILGLALSAVVAVLIPDDWFVRVNELDSTGLLTKFAALAVGIPWYVCATASTPLAAALIAAGVSPGAALVLLLAGPATNPATMGWVWRDLGGRALAIYLAGISIGALAAGILTDLVLPSGPVRAAATLATDAHHHGAVPARAALAALVALILLSGAMHTVAQSLRRTLSRRTHPTARACCADEASIH